MSTVSIKERLSKMKQADLMALFNVSDRTIQRWHDKDLPRHGSGVGCYYVWAEVLPWYLAFVSGSKKPGEDISDKERKLKAEADLAEMEAAKEAGQLLDAIEVQQAWEGFLSRLKVNLDGLPDRAAPLIEDGMNLAEKVAAIRRELNSVRRDLVAETERNAEHAEAV